MTAPQSNRRNGFGFTLIELLVATSILLVILGILLSMTSTASRIWQFGSARVSAFQSSRFAFETMTRAISSATLNTYYDYYGTTTLPSNLGPSPDFRTTLNSGTSSGVNAIFTPYAYGRRSELEFCCGTNLLTATAAGIQQITDSIFFQTPLNYTQTADSATVGNSSYTSLEGLLNTIGFFVEFSDDSSRIPTYVKSQPRYRYRLMELLEPTENFSVYSNTITTGSYPWFTNPLQVYSNNPTSSSDVRLLAENIVACIICPRLSSDPATTGSFTSSLTTNYNYDSVLGNPAGILNFQGSTASVATTGTTAPAISATTWAIGQPQPTNMNQLPPVVRVVLVAADENSMLHLQGLSTAPPNLGFSSTGANAVFQSTADPTKFDTDLATVTSQLTANHVNFRVFQTDVAVRGAKWSH